MTATGDWLPDRLAFVQAGTELGSGYWVMTPLVRNDGTTVLVNRGFVPGDKRSPLSWRAERQRSVTVTGLLRLSEPGGAFLRANEPASNRWYSRDVPAIAASCGLAQAAPYFIDAERAPGESGLPVAGLTVIAFSNNHLIYAITWGALAVMAAAGVIFVNLDLARRGRWEWAHHRTDRRGVGKSDHS